MSARGRNINARGRRIMASCAPAAASLALAALMLGGQSGRDVYRDAYRVWRESEPNLERDAAAGAAQLSPRADRVAAEAAKYCSERRAFLDRFARDSEQKLAWLETPALPAPPLPAAGGEYIAAQTAAVRRGIDTFANDADPGIQEVRAMLERENVALSALAASAAARQTAAEEADLASSAMEPARLKALELDRAFAAETRHAGEQAEAETPAWAEYYRLLADAARGVARSPSVPAARPVERAPRPIPSTSSITPLPLFRYTGEWILQPKGMYHGTQPDSVELAVREDHGHCAGQMVAHFILPAGGGDPELRFEFSGEFQNTVRQTFALTTSDGAKGTIDLIPSGAFNLLEINVQIAANPGKVRQANIVLVKK